MLKVIFQIGCVLFFLVSCGESTDKEQKPQPMVYEGMSAEELRYVLGNPDQIESKNEIFDAQTMTKMTLEHWIYEKRTVLLINDTVKNPNLNL